MAIQSYRELEVWNLAVDLVSEIYMLTERFPKKEQFILTAQICRASISIPSNIAEGYGRKHRGEYVHHLSIAKGSLCEVETQLIIAGRLKYVTKEEVRKAWDMTQSIGKMLTAMLGKLGK